MNITRRFALTAGAAAFALPTLARAEDVPIARSPGGAILAEGPLWSAVDNTVYWVDIRGKKLNALRLADNSAQSWDMPDLIDWIVLRKSGGFLVAILRTVHALTLDPFKLTPLFEIEADKTDNRLNDAKVDAKGRLWTGTMHMPFSQKTAALYRVDADLSVHQVDAPYLCRGGACGQCETKVLAADGTLLHHDHYLSPAEKAGGQKIMTCVSRLAGRELVLDL